jgi:hypothetical protein
LLLLGILFAVWHYDNDSSQSFTDSLVLVQRILRLLLSVVLSFVLGWLTLRTGSILPATLAHMIYDLTAGSSAYERHPAKSESQFLFVWPQPAPATDWPCWHMRSTIRMRLSRATQPTVAGNLQSESLAMAQCKQMCRQNWRHGRLPA